MGRRRISSVSSLKKEADRVFSIYIRQKYADEHGQVHCFTCEKVDNWKRLQNGHFVSRSFNNTRFDEENCHPQCVGCNMFKAGNMDVYALRLTEKYGQDILKRLHEKKLKLRKFKPEDLQEIIDKYTLSTQKS